MALIEKTREGVYGITLHGGRVLMCHTVCRGRIIQNFPGGGIEPGERPEEALAREFREETGTAGIVGRLLHTTADRVFLAPDYPGVRLSYHYYLVSADPNAIRLEGNGEDVSRLEWHQAAQLPQDQMLEVDWEAWRAIFKLLTLDHGSPEGA